MGWADMFAMRDKRLHQNNADINPYMHDTSAGGWSYDQELGEGTNSATGAYFQWSSPSTASGPNPPLEAIEFRVATPDLFCGSGYGSLATFWPPGGLMNASFEESLPEQFPNPAGGYASMVPFIPGQGVTYLSLIHI